MDKNGNLNEEEKLKLATLLLKAKTWWNTNPTVDDTLDLIETFEDFRKELEK